MSRFRDKVRMVRIADGDRAHIDQLGSVTAQPATIRHGDTPLTDTPHSRRQITLTPYKHADLVDKADQIRTLNDPTNPYMVAFGRAFGRAIDDVIVEAAFATASTGVDGSGSAAFDTGDFQFGSGSALTIDKIAQANRVLRENENDPEDGFFLALSQDQIEDLLVDTTAASKDYNSVRLLMTGEINTFLGFTIVPTERLLGNRGSGAERGCIAWARNSLALAVGQEPSGRISERDDKNYSTQVFMSMDIGATRMDETGVVEIECTE
jgi:hypothetical protein